MAPRTLRPMGGKGTAELSKKLGAKGASAKLPTRKGTKTTPAKKEAVKRSKASAKGQKTLRINTESTMPVKRVGKRKADGTVEEAVHIGGQDTKKKLKGDGGNTMLSQASPPSRNKKGELVFEDFPNFRPNMTPKEVLHAGSFGGTYFRPIYSGVTKQNYKDAWKELPKGWLEGLNIPKQVASPAYREEINTYKVKCGGSLDMWESHGWITPQDPYGWFQWYCRFFQGRRTPDDLRQIGRWDRCTGKTGRWRGNLISKIVQSGCVYDDKAVSPVVRQTLQHWGYRLTPEHYEQGAKKTVTLVPGTQPVYWRETV